MEFTDYPSLKNEGARFAFFSGVFGPQSTEAILDDLLGYIDHTKHNLEAAGFDEDEALRTSADTVFGSVSAYLKECGNTRSVERLHHVDDLIRAVHDIDEREFPGRHEDPIVASFFTTLQNHLNQRMPGDRYDPYGGYTT